MKIFYNRNKIPTIVINDVAYMFNSLDREELVAQFSVDPTTSTQIKEEIVDYVNSIKNVEDISKESSCQEIKNKIKNFVLLETLFFVLDIIDEAESMAFMLSVPQPYKSWQWDYGDRKWVPPAKYPKNADEGIYFWDENLEDWTPSELKPHNSWMWDKMRLKYVPPIPYPVDAEEHEFVWNEATLSWKKNV